MLTRAGFCPRALKLAHATCSCVCWQGKQRVLRRDSVVRVELAELSAELDLDILSRLGSLSQAFSYRPTQRTGSDRIQVKHLVQLLHLNQCNTGKINSKIYDFY